MHSTKNRDNIKRIPLRPRKPKVLPVNSDGIPAELKARKQWVLWRLKYQDGKWTKPPCQPNGRNASSTNSATWSSFNTVRKAYERGGFDGVGFALTAEDEIVFIDLDGCRDPQTGGISPWSSRLRNLFNSDAPEPELLIEGMDTFCEVSPSGSGFHLFCIGHLPSDRCKLGGKTNSCPDAIEIYDDKRYATVTGHRVPNRPATVNECNAPLKKLHRSIFGDNERPRLKQRPASGFSPSDEIVLNRLFNAKNGNKAKRLWDGDATGYPSPSEADLAMVGLLAFWTQDPEQIERLLWQTGLVREKWNRADYLSRTIDKVLETQTEFYDWRFPQTDTGLAERLAAQYGAQFRYCHPWRKFLVWNGRRWKEDDIGAMQQLAKDTVRSILDEARREAEDARRRVLIEFAGKSESAFRRKAMLELVKSETGVPILPENLDQDRWLLNCENGTLDLKTGELRGHRQDDYISRMAPVEYDPAANCPRWLQFLDEIFEGRKPLVDFMQRLLGHCLTGDVSEDILPIFYGVGANGKTTLVNVILELLGIDYAMSARSELLMFKTYDSHPTERMSLFRKRFVACIESGEGRRLNEAFVKQLTGRDTIRGRRMREDDWEFSPTHKLILSTNHKPTIRGTDYAMWRRIHLVPFTRIFAKDERDKHLKDKLVLEAPGILAWCVRGCLDWQSGGLQAPEEVMMATKHYRSEQDILSRFLDECCRVDRDDPELKCLATPLFKRFQDFSGDKTMTQQAFGRALGERGFTREKKGRISWAGLALADDDDVLYESRKRKMRRGRSNPPTHKG